MPRTKLHDSELDDADLVRVLKALGDARRFRMVQEIAAAGELSCGQLGEKFGLAQPTISHHLKLLLDAGVLQARHEAQRHFLSVAPGLLDAVAGVLAARLGASKLRRPGKRRRA